MPTGMSLWIIHFEELQKMELTTAHLHTVLKNVYGFQGVFARNQLPEGKLTWPCAMVLNTDPAHKPGEHWVASYIDSEGHGEYFDSFGLEPPKVFSKFMNCSCLKWIWNKVTLQDLFTTACGHFCAFYLLHCSEGTSLAEIVDFLLNQECDDCYVTDFIHAFL